MLGVYMALLETEEDRERFDKLYRQHREQLFRIALSVMKDICSAEDVVSEVFMIIAKKTFQHSGKKTDRELFGYIAIITRNRAIDIYRRQKKVKRKPLPLMRHTAKQNLCRMHLPEKRMKR